MEVWILTTSHDLVSCFTLRSAVYLVLSFPLPPTTLSSSTRTTTITMPTKSKFIISHPSRASASFEAARIAQIHLLAMQTNPLLHAQFPTRKSQDTLECFLARDTQQKMSPPQTSTHRDEGIWVARLEGEDEIAGFIRWEYPPPIVDRGKGKKSDEDKKKKLEDGEIQYFAGCRREYLEEYARLASEAKERSGFMKTRCWRKFVSVTPIHVLYT